MVRGVVDFEVQVWAGGTSRTADDTEELARRVRGLWSWPGAQANFVRPKGKCETVTFIAPSIALPSSESTPLGSAPACEMRLPTRFAAVAYAPEMSGPNTRPTMPDPSTWETVIPNSLTALMRAIEELDSCLDGWGADANARYLAQLAVEELGTNIIKYGYDDQKDHLIRVTVARDEQVFRISIEDDGHEFNPCLAPEPDPNRNLQERAPGGWGLSLVRRLVAGLHYERQGSRNVVRVEVRRPSRSSSHEPGSPASGTSSNIPSE